MGRPSALLLLILAGLELAIAGQDQRVSIILLHRRGSSECGVRSDFAAVVNGSSATTMSPGAAALILSAGQRETAARWASEINNNQTRPHLFSIDVEVMDTCGSVATTALRSLQIVRRTNRTALLGVIALEEAAVLSEAARVFRRHRIPLVVATPRAASEAAQLVQDADDADPASLLQPDNVFSAVPNTAAIARATMAVAKGIQSPSIRILGTCWRTMRMAERAARQLGIRVASSQHFLMDFSADVDAFLNSPGSNPNTPVALLMEPEELVSFMSSAVRRPSGRRITWLLGSVGSISPQAAAQWALDLSRSAFLVEPHLSELAGLSDYLQKNGLPHHPLDDQIPHIVQAVSALGAAFHLQELASCVQQQLSTSGSEPANFTCGIQTEPSRVPSQMLSSLRQLSLPPAESSPGGGSSGDRASGVRQLEGTSNHFTPAGRLVAHKYLVKKLMAGSGESSPVAWYSDDDGLVLAAVMTSQSRFDFFGHASSGPLLSSVQPFSSSSSPEEIDPADSEEDENPKSSWTPDPQVVLDNTLMQTASPAGHSNFHFNERTWAASILAVSATEFLAVLYILAVYSARCWDGTIPRPASQSLYFALLIVLLAQLASVTLYVLPVHSNLKSILPPVLLVTGYALLLAKLVQLRCLASAGLGGSVPQFPLYLAVALSASVQLALSSVQQEDVIVLYSFLAVYVILTACYALIQRRIRKDHVEAQLILIGTLVSSLLILGWILAVWFIADEVSVEALTAALIVLLSAALIGSVFIPKTIQLSARRNKHVLASSAAGPRPSSYACNISMANHIPSPWLDYTFTHHHNKGTKQQVVLNGGHLTRHPAYTGSLCNTITKH